ncbi:MAG: NAD(P)-dependent oxidoreductase, partial [Deltaproteobacteria bacterium HGW-Deltaproteobacteria-20]
MRFVVTGASGHLGASLTNLLLGGGHDVLAIVRPQSDLYRLEGALDSVTLAYAGLEDLSACAEEIAEFRPDVAVHLGWMGVTAEHRHSDAQITTNVTGTLDFFRIVRDAGCTAFIGVGSQAEYGPYDVALTEDLPVRPVTAYGVAKLSCGLLTSKLAELAGM